jgi:hypothetical protein
LLTPLKLMDADAGLVRPDSRNATTFSVNIAGTHRECVEVAGQIGLHRAHARRMRRQAAYAGAFLVSHS